MLGARFGAVKRRRKVRSGQQGGVRVFCLTWAVCMGKILPLCSARTSGGRLKRPNFAEIFGMYAVIQTGGKQYRVSQGDTLRIEKLAAEEGASVDLDKVLLVSDGDEVKLGAPYVDGGKVTATVKTHGRAKKVNILKFKRRKHHLKRQGHRQWYTELEITGISVG